MWRLLLRELGFTALAFSCLMGGGLVGCLLSPRDDSLLAQELPFIFGALGMFGCMAARRWLGRGFA